MLQAFTPKWTDAVATSMTAARVMPSGLADVLTLAAPDARSSFAIRGGRVWPSDKAGKTVIVAPRDVWRGVVAGTTDPTEEYLTGRIKLEGSILELVHYVDLLPAMLAALRRVPTTW